MLTSNVEFESSLFENTNKEVSLLYKKFQDGVTAVKFKKDMFLTEEHDVLNLVNLAKAFTVFDEENNEQAKGTCLNNIGNIHFRNQKYDLAVKSYRKAVEIARDEL